jgi:adenylate kinase family enzyme
MRRILLIGPGGAGKSTLARAIAEHLDLPLIHLDTLYWRPGWVKTPDAEWRRTVENLLRSDAWVMDGNYGGTLDLRLAACDTVIFMDMPPHVCLWRVLKRRLEHRGAARPEMTPGCPERIDSGFLMWIAFYRLRRRAAVLDRLRRAMREGKRTFVLDSRAAVEDFLARCLRLP